jgi:hypothetical protein
LNVVPLYALVVVGQKGLGNVETEGVVMDVEIEVCLALLTLILVELIVDSVDVDIDEETGDTDEEAGDADVVVVVVGC